MTLYPATNRQLPDNSILDLMGKQCYLGNQYSIYQNFTIGASETALILLQNAQTGSQQTLKSIFQNFMRMVQTSSTKTSILNIYLNPTITSAGTPITPTNMRIAYGSHSIATASASPTISANGTQINSISASTLSMGDSNLLSILDDNQSLLITGTGSSSGTTLSLIVQWYEI